MSVRAPFTALCASYIARVLDESISLAGLGNTAKSFLATRATSAIEGKKEPEIVRKVGQWTNLEVFYAHYVHSQALQEFSDVLR